MDASPSVTSSRPWRRARAPARVRIVYRLLPGGRLLRPLACVKPTRYATDSVQFQLGDITEKLPPTDLLIVKDVLQHLPDQPIKKFIRNNLVPERYRWIILTNDRWPTMDECLIRPDPHLCKLATQRRPVNIDVKAGRYRALDLSAKPFEVEGLKDVLRFKTHPLKVVRGWAGRGNRRRANGM